MTSGKITVRYFAVAREAAGVAEEQAEAGLLGDVLAQLAAAHSERLGKILAASAFLIDGEQATDRGQAVPAGCKLDVLPPFAGG